MSGGATGAQVAVRGGVQAEHQGEGRGGAGEGAGGARTAHCTATGLTQRINRVQSIMHDCLISKEKEKIIMLCRY